MSSSVSEHQKDTTTNHRTLIKNVLSSYYFWNYLSITFSTSWHIQEVHSHILCHEQQNDVKNVLRNHVKTRTQKSMKSSSLFIFFINYIFEKLLCWRLSWYQTFMDKMYTSWPTSVWQFGKGSSNCCFSTWDSPELAGDSQILTRLLLNLNSWHFLLCSWA